jgi:tetratricopeptide (TPR) repeat protein
VEAAPRRLVGRDDQREELWRYAVAVLDQGAAAVLLTGPAGIGKTSLAAELAARHDGPVRRATAAEWESARPYGVLAQLLGADPAALPLGDPFATAGLLDDRIGRDRPLLVTVDDTHWADPDSLRVLSTLVRHHRDLPVLAVLIGRLERAPSAVADLLRRTATHAIHLGPLGAGAVGELAAEHGRPLPPWVAERLTCHTEGTPRHVLALLDELPSGLWSTPDLRLPPPAEVGVWVDERLAELAPDARTLLDATAAMALPASLDELARVACLDDVLAPLDDAARRGLVRRFGGRSIPVVGPADPMSRAAVLDALGPRAAARMRLRAAEVVTEPARRLAYLAAACPGPDPELAGQLVALARDKTADGAWSAAADALLAAGRLTEERDLRELRLISAVDAMIGAGEVLEAGATVPVVEDLRNTPLRNAVLGYLAILLGRAAEAPSRLTRAWELVDPDREPGTAAWICQRHVLDALVRCRGHDLVAWADRAAALVGPEAPAAVEAAAIRGLGTAASGQPGDAVEEYRIATERIPQGAQVQRVVMGQGWLNLVVDEYDDARAELESAIPTTTLGGSSRISLWALGWLARVHFLTGDWDLALRSVEQGMRLAQQTGIVIVTPLLAWTATQIHSLRGDRERAERAVQAAEAGAQDYEMMSIPRHLARAHLAEIRADYATVLRTLRPLTRAPEESCVAEPGWWPWPDVYANALVLGGAPRRGRRVPDRARASRGRAWPPVEHRAARVGPGAVARCPRRPRPGAGGVRGVPRVSRRAPVALGSGPGALRVRADAAAGGETTRRRHRPLGRP